MSDHYNIPIEDLMAIEVQIANKSAFEALAKSFQYDEGRSVGQNLRGLAETLAGFLRVEGRTRRSLEEYLVEKNMPIEVTFRPLRADQLQAILEEWVSLHTESSTIIEKLYSNNHRNLLFKRVLFEERPAIDDYFQTLSDKLMLRGVDLYQLLVDILSPYHLYEYHLDAETFFEKVNSLNSFLAVVARFVHSEKRISVGINASDADYIRRFEFERLIEFWEGENPELLLLSERRKNHLDQQTQTTRGDTRDQTVQTDRPTASLPEIINETLKALNRITPDNNSVQELEAIERIYSFLRREKILHLQESPSPLHLQEEALELNSQKTEKKAVSPTSHVLSGGKLQVDILSLVEHFNQNETLGSIEQQHNPPDQGTSKNSCLQIRASPKLAETLRSIYNLYFTHSHDLAQLEKCLSDISVERKEIEQASERVAKGRNKGTLRVYYHQFERAMLDLMGRDRFLTDRVLEDFLKAKRDELLPPPPSPSRLSSAFPLRHGLTFPYYRY